MRHKVVSVILIALCISALAATVAAAAAAPAFTAEELNIIEGSKSEPVTVGIIDTSAPMCYWSKEKKSFVGNTMEILDAVSKKTGLRMKYVKLDLTKKPPVAWLKDGATQLIAGILKTKKFENDRELVLSGTLLDSSLVVVGYKGHDFMKDPSNKKIALMNGFQVAQEYVAEQFPKHKVVKYDTLKDCLNAIALGRADATVYLRSCVNYALQNPHFEDLEVNPAFAKNVELCAAGLSSETAQLLAIVDKGLTMITNDEHNNIIMNYTVMNPYQLTHADTLFKYRVPIAVITVLLIIVIVSLLSLIAFRRRSQNTLEAAYEQEKAALKLAEKANSAKGDFMSRMSHEIRTPLNAVIGYNSIARSAMSGAKTDEELRQAGMKVLDYLTKSDIASRHLLTIINDVLDISAVESGKMQVAHERFDFKNLISSLTVLFFTQAKARGVDFEVVFDTLTEEWFVGDQLRVNQILTNLLSNAVKFTPKGGRVRLIVRQPEADVNAAHISFEVTDTGIGMDEEYLAHIWMPFEQADSSISRRFGGTGLGLSITKNLVDLMNGKISVESSPGVGTTFRLDLTFERTEQPTIDKAYDFTLVNALVVDDDPSTCEYVKLLFDRCGARCKTVCSGQEAIDAVAASNNDGERFTLCLIDWQMPELNGVETVKRLKQIAKYEIPLIIVTAYDYSGIEDEANAAGVNMFISKPLFQSTLFDLLASVSGKTPDVREKASDKFNFAGSRILLAEDNEMNMEIAQNILANAGLVVDPAWNGKETVAMFESAPVGTYKAILMDVQMPEMDGYEATQMIRESSHPEAKTVPIIAMTANAFAENVSEAIAAGMNDHIAKPIDVDKLFTTLQKYIK